MRVNIVLPITEFVIDIRYYLIKIRDFLLPFRNYLLSKGNLLIPQKPFEVKIPNKETLKALENSRNRKNLTTYKSSDELFEDLGI
jgi:hypothetical protein